MKHNRKDWTDYFFDKGFFDSSQKSNRPARVKKALGLDGIIFCDVKSETIKGKTVHHATTGAYMILGDGYVTVKLPYGISANDIWRATIDEKGKQRNSLSLSAKHYKKNIHQCYAPMFKKIGWKAINRLCEIRLIVQPPLKDRNYSANTYPRFDIDNYPKLIIDSLKGVDLLFKDDSIFIHEQIQLAEPVKDGCVWLSCIFINETNWLNKKVNFDWLAGR